jgi:hypothetical protein
VDLTSVKVDYVCGNEFRVQNHSGAALTLAVETTRPGGGTRTDYFTFPAIGGWTAFTVADPGPIRVTHDGQPVGTVANTGRRCGGG